MQLSRMESMTPPPPQKTYTPWNTHSRHGAAPIAPIAQLTASHLIRAPGHQIWAYDWKKNQRRLMTQPSWPAHSSQSKLLYHHWGLQSASFSEGSLHQSTGSFHLKYSQLRGGEVYMRMDPHPYRGKPNAELPKTSRQHTSPPRVFWRCSPFGRELLHNYGFTLGGIQTLRVFEVTLGTLGAAMFSVLTAHCLQRAATKTQTATTKHPNAFQRWDFFPPVSVLW